MNLTILSIASVDLLLCPSAELEHRHLTRSGYSAILELHSGYSARAQARSDNFGTLSVYSVKWCRRFLLRELVGNVVCCHYYNYEQMCTPNNMVLLCNLVEEKPVT